MPWITITAGDRRAGSGAVDRRGAPGRPPGAVAHWTSVPPFGIYVHVPFCAARCGYCDFNTYTASELAGSGASAEGWLDAVRRELDRAASVVGERPVDTVFVV